MTRQLYLTEIYSSSINLVIPIEDPCPLEDNIYKIKLTFISKKGKSSKIQDGYLLQVDSNRPRSLLYVPHKLASPLVLDLETMLIVNNKDIQKGSISGVEYHLSSLRNLINFVGIRNTGVSKYLRFLADSIDGGRFERNEIKSMDFRLGYGNHNNLVN